MKRYLSKENKEKHSDYVLTKVRKTYIVSNCQQLVIK